MNKLFCNLHVVYWLNAKMTMHQSSALKRKILWAVFSVTVLFTRKKVDKE